MTELEILDPLWYRPDGTKRKVPLSPARLKSLAKARAVRMEKRKLQDVLKAEKRLQAAMDKIGAITEKTTPEEVTLEIIPSPVQSPPPQTPIPQIQIQTQTPVSIETVPQKEMSKDLNWLNGIVKNPQSVESGDESLVGVIKNKAKEKGMSVVNYAKENPGKVALVSGILLTLLYHKYKK